MSLSTPYDDGNIFARIIRDEIPAIKVFEDPIALAFMDIFPQSDGHTLVIPKSLGATNILDADGGTLSALIGRVQLVAKAVADALDPDGVRIMQFNGAPAGQTIFHLHFHIIPVYAAPPLKGHAAEKANAAHLETLAAKIRSAVARQTGD